MRNTLLVVVALAAATSISVAGQEPERRLGGLSPTIESLAGVDTYRYYCLPCHGEEGTGNGPVASLLKTPVPDLTTLSARNGGSFPSARVRAAVANTERPITAHGSGDMPVWKTIFGVLESKHRVEVRIDSVVRYVETLQPGSAAAIDRGRSLFSAHCASCHGADARGNGPVAAQLRHTVPDLTRFALRNGGVFPSARVSRIIDGRDIAAHGSTEMPVWGNAFLRTPGVWTDADVTRRIAALTAYLEAIQQRNGE